MSYGKKRLHDAMYDTGQHANICWKYMIRIVGSVYMCNIGEIFTQIYTDDKQKTHQ